MPEVGNGIRARINVTRNTKGYQWDATVEVDRTTDAPDDERGAVDAAMDLSQRVRGQLDRLYPATVDWKVSTPESLAPDEVQE